MPGVVSVLDDRLPPTRRAVKTVIVKTVVATLETGDYILQGHERGGRRRTQGRPLGDPPEHLDEGSGPVRPGT